MVVNRSAGLLLLALVTLGACAPVIEDAERTPAGTVRTAFELLARHDIATAALLGCPERREPGRMPMAVSGILSPTAAVQMPEFAESIAFFDIDISDVRVEDVPTFGQAQVLVPVTGIMRVSADPAEIEAVVRATAAEGGEAVDEGVLEETLDGIRAGPTELDLGQEMDGVRVVPVGERWLICEHAPSPAPALPSGG
jgi:hypothetical protein